MESRIRMTCAYCRWKCSKLCRVLVAPSLITNYSTYYVRVRGPERTSTSRFGQLFSDCFSSVSLFNFMATFIVHSSSSSSFYGVGPEEELFSSRVCFGSIFDTKILFFSLFFMA